MAEHWIVAPAVGGSNPLGHPPFDTPAGTVSLAFISASAFGGQARDAAIDTPRIAMITPSDTSIGIF